MSEETRRMLMSDLRPEFHLQEARALLQAVTDIHASMARWVAFCKRLGYRDVTPNDVAVLLQVFAGETANGIGSRPATIIRALALPRYVVRDALTKHVAAGLILRSKRGVYRPTVAIAKPANEAWPGIYSDSGRLSEAFAAYSRALVSRG